MNRNRPDPWFYSILIILFIAIWGSAELVREEYELTNVCPLIFGIPACYLVLGCFILVLVGHLFNTSWSYWNYFLPLLFVASIALIGSIGNLMGYLQCPQTASGIPMCYISLAICLSLLVLKYCEMLRHLSK